MNSEDEDVTVLSLGSLARLLALQNAIIARNEFCPGPADWCRAWFTSFVTLYNAAPIWPTHADDMALGVGYGTLDQGAWELVGAEEATELPCGRFVVFQQEWLVH